MRSVSFSELRDNLSFYLEIVRYGESLIVTKKGSVICEIHPRTTAKLELFDSLTGICSGVDAIEARNERLGLKSI